MIIPFRKAVRLGNFKLWRGNYKVNEATIESLHISNLDGSWMIRIPSTSTMFGTIMQGYATVDPEIRENFLGMILTNIYNCSTCSSEALHDAFHFLVEMMTFPYMLLPEKEMEKRMMKGMLDAGMDRKKASEHISQMMDYRRQLYELIERKKKAYIDEYERQQAERRGKEDEAFRDLERDEIAEQAIGILNDAAGS